jgi:hypothetical protein
LSQIPNTGTKTGARHVVVEGIQATGSRKSNLGMVVKSYGRLPAAGRLKGDRLAGRYLWKQMAKVLLIARLDYLHSADDFFRPSEAETMIYLLKYRLSAGRFFWTLSV